MKKLIVVGLGALLAASLFAQSTNTTTFTQTGGVGCHVTGCANAALNDGETFSFTDTLQYYGTYSILGKLTFRAIGYSMSGQASGYQTIDLSNAQGFAVHEDYAVHCYRGCSQTWKDGSLTIPKEYVGVQVDTSVLMYTNVFGQVVQQYPNWPPTAFGGQVYRSSGYIEGPLNGTVQVGLASVSDVDVTVKLASSDPTFTVPSQITIPAGSLYANGSITAVTVGSGVVATITATFPDGTTSTITVTDDPGPAQPSDS